MQKNEKLRYYDRVKRHIKRTLDQVRPEMLKKNMMEKEEQDVFQEEEQNPRNQKGNVGGKKLI